MRTSFDAADVQQAVERLVGQVSAAFPSDQPLCIIGIRTRGETLAQRLTQQLRQKGFTIERGVLDITLYRDDLSQAGAGAVVRPTDIAIDIQGKAVLLVDDVLFTGRSTRAALDALVDFGRPRLIRLAVLVDRGGRELPIQADFVGLALRDIPVDHRVNVRLLEDDGQDQITVEPRRP